MLIWSSAIWKSRGAVEMFVLTGSALLCGSLWTTILPMGAQRNTLSFTKKNTDRKALQRLMTASRSLLDVRWGNDLEEAVYICKFINIYIYIIYIWFRRVLLCCLYFLSDILRHIKQKVQLKYVLSKYSLRCFENFTKRPPFFFFCRIRILS